MSQHNVNKEKQKIRFVMNANGPKFDRYSMLCIKSILRACGDSTLISVYQPDNLPPVSDLAKRFYGKYGIEVVNFHNEFLPDRVDNLDILPDRYLTLNKLYCLQDIEPFEKRVFVDADTIFLEDPTPYFRGIIEPIACPLVDTPEAFGGDWEKLYSAVGVPYPSQRVKVWSTYVYGDAPAPPMVEIPPYFTSCVVYVHGSSKLPGIWMDMCRELEEKIELIPKSFFLDQIALSIAVQKSREPWRLMPKGLSCSYEVWRFTNDIKIFHYVLFDTLAAGVARFPKLREVCSDVVTSLAREDGLDLCFQILTQWPRWKRRLLGIASHYSDKFFRLPLIRVKERV